MIASQEFMERRMPQREIARCEWCGRQFIRLRYGKLNAGINLSGKIRRVTDKTCGNEDCEREYNREHHLEMCKKRNKK